VNRRALGLVVALVATFVTSDAREVSAFPYVAKKSDTLADIAQRFYGKVELEKVLVAANGLGTEVPLMPGMRIEVPAVTYHTIAPGEGWEPLAERYLGDPRRAEALALANDTMPWLPPKVGREIVIPFTLRYVVRPGDSTPSIAYRFLGKRDDAYVIDRFNELKGDPVKPGDVVLIPLHDLELTDLGRDAARFGLASTENEGAGDDRDAQDRATRELPALETEVRRGDYLDAIVRGNQLLGAGDLTNDSLARIHRALVEAYVAIDAEPMAEAACAEWRRAAPDVALDPIELSPKILRACATVAGAAHRGVIPDDDAAASSASAAPSADRPPRAPRPHGESP
jgi:LysM repeat protein